MSFSLKRLFSRASFRLFVEIPRVFVGPSTKIRAAEIILLVSVRDNAEAHGMRELGYSQRKTLIDVF